MGLVAFEQILKVQPDQASPISALNNALGPAAPTIVTESGQPLQDESGNQLGADTPRGTLYDPLWGYFLFGQSLKMEYHDTYSYMDKGEFTIAGQFTINAEDSLAGNVSTTDDIKFNRCIAKLNALEAAFQAAGKAAAPMNYLDWGTANDLRCIPLPPPLFDANGNTIYCNPVEINVEPGQWGNFIAYRATLREAKYPPAKVMVNQTFIDDGVITINCPKPILVRTPLVGCCGEVIQCSNYTVQEIEVNGTINGVHTDGRSMSDAARDMLTSLTADKVSVGVQRIVGQAIILDSLFTGYSLDEGGGAEIHYVEQAVQVNIKAKAGHF